MLILDAAADAQAVYAVDLLVAAAAAIDGASTFAVFAADYNCAVKSAAATVATHATFTRTVDVSL